MKFSSPDKISETVSLIRNKKKYFIGKNKYIIKKNRVLACFQTRPVYSYVNIWLWQYIDLFIQMSTGHWTHGFEFSGRVDAREEVYSEGHQN